MIANQRINNCEDGRKIFQELAFMLHLRETDKNYTEVFDAEGFTESIRLYDGENRLFNNSVMYSLIDSGVIKKLLSSDNISKNDDHRRNEKSLNQGEYARWLKDMLESNQRT